MKVKFCVITHQILNTHKEVDYTMIEKDYNEIKQRIEPMFQSSKNKDVIIDIILNG